MEVVIKSNGVVVAHKELRNEMHFDIQRANRTQTIKPKKGKGSFKRKEKYEWWR